jgi:hypothetical protein
LAGDAGNVHRRHRVVTAALGLVGVVGLVSLAPSCSSEVGLSCPPRAQPFSPTGLAFGAAGELYVTGVPNGSVSCVDDQRCIAIAEVWSRPFGVAVLDDVCAFEVP